MVRRRQQDAKAGAGIRTQDGADSVEAAERADAANASYAKRLEVVAKLEKYAWVEGAQQEMAEEKEEQAGERRNEQGEGSEDDTVQGGPEGEEDGRGNDGVEQENVEELVIGEPTLRDIYELIRSCKAAITTLTHRVDGTIAEVTTIKADMGKMDKRVGEVEERVSVLEDHISKMQKAHTQCLQKCAALINKTDDLENRSRRNNVRLVGIPEKTEGNDTTKFIEKWLQDKIGGDNLSKMFVVERAHRVPMKPLPMGSPPRTVLAKILNYRDRDAILRCVRTAEDMCINGQKISIYPDYSAEVQKQRMSYGGVKRRLRDLKLVYSTLFPAKLRVVALGTVHFFPTPEDATKWLDLNQQKLSANKERGK
ncbi:uncharacterized protein [Dendrobates tinctorius]|uniref:uncharacterized protein n=1 Tax=Dendrobates tinctorius TaxID=92724 RepID=UPI003CC9DF73